MSTAMKSFQAAAGPCEVVEQPNSTATGPLFEFWVVAVHLVEWLQGGHVCSLRARLFFEHYLLDNATPRVSARMIRQMAEECSVDRVFIPRICHTLVNQPICAALELQKRYVTACLEHWAAIRMHKGV